MPGDNWFSLVLLISLLDTSSSLPERVYPQHMYRLCWSITCIYHRIVGKHLIILGSWLYAGKNYWQAYNWVAYKECIYLYKSYRIVASIVCILYIALFEPIRV